MKKQYPFQKENRFYNYKNETVLITLKEVIAHYIINIFNTDYLYESRKNNNAVPFSLFCKDLYFLDRKISDDIVIVPLGHATVLIIYKKITILFDPLFGSSSFFLKRYAEYIDINLLPPIEIIVFSHNHPDHYNKSDLLKLLDHSPGVKIFGPSEFSIFLERENIINCQMKSMMWWEEVIVDPLGLITLTALPAIHWSQSNFMDKNQTLWASWMLTVGDVAIYFGGDTAYSNHFITIKEYFKKIDIACIPIGPCEPPYIQINSHMSVEQSFQSFLDLGEPLFIPIHWGVFAYGDEPLKYSIEKIMILFYQYGCINKLQSTILNTPLIYNKKDFRIANIKNN